MITCLKRKSSFDSGTTAGTAAIFKKARFGSDHGTKRRRFILRLRVEKRSIRACPAEAEEKAEEKAEAEAEASGRKRRLNEISASDSAIDLIVDDFTEMAIKKQKGEGPFKKAKLVLKSRSAATHYAVYDNPGQYAAIDIQRLIRGWLTRKNIGRWLQARASGIPYDSFLYGKNTIF
jgi:hypothetical protein